VTKVQAQFRLSGSLNDAMLARIADAHTIYGIYRVKLAPELDGLSVEYDATRLRPAEVESALAAAGIPVTRSAVS
jgi:hypothetical protein